MLFESMLLSNKNVRFLIEHKKRLFGSAEYFDFPLDEEKWNAAIKEILQWKALPDKVYKIRIFLDKRGSFSWDGELIQKRGPQETARVVIARKPIAVDTPFLFHKTTYRPWYKAAAEQIHTGACFDVLHFNKQNQLTEGARSNLFILKQGTLFTSPVMCGLLPGVLRGRLLRAGKCAERILYRKDLYGADAVFCGNSVRGLVRVEVAGM